MLGPSRASVGFAGRPEAGAAARYELTGLRERRTTERSRSPV